MNFFFGENYGPAPRDSPPTWWELTCDFARHAGVNIVFLVVGFFLLRLGVFLLGKEFWTTYVISRWTQISVALGIVLIGRLFYWCRENYGRLYGLLEIGAAAATSVISLELPSQAASGLLPKAIIFLGGLYIAVRGFDNYYGWPEKQRKRDEARARLRRATPPQKIVIPATPLPTTSPTSVRSSEAGPQ